MGVNQYANPKEKPLERPAVDAKAFHKRRVQQVAAHRTSLEEDESEVVLEKLAKVVESQGRDAVRSLRGSSRCRARRSARSPAPCASTTAPAQPITPVCITRAAAAFEQLREAMDRYAASTGERASGIPLQHGLRCASTRRAPISRRGFFAVGGYEVDLARRASRPRRRGGGLRRSRRPASRSSAPPTRITRPWCRRWSRRSGPGGPTRSSSWPAIRRTRSRRTKQAGVDEFIHIRADAVELLTKFHSTTWHRIMKTFPDFTQDRL